MLASEPTDPPSRPRRKKGANMQGTKRARAACSGDRTGPGISYATCDIKLINTVYRVPHLSFREPSTLRFHIFPRQREDHLTNSDKVSLGRRHHDAQSYSHPRMGGGNRNRPSSPVRELDTPSMEGISTSARHSRSLFEVIKTVLASSTRPTTYHTAI